MNIKNIVFEGGGVRGIAYGGAIEQLNNMEMLNTLENVAGSSAGAISACLLALGAKPNDLSQLLKNINYRDFQDNQFGIIRDAFRFLSRFGWNPGSVFYEWIQYQIEDIANLDPNITLLELENANVGPTLNVVSANITLGKSTIFNYKNFPDLKVADAVRASMAYPFFFTPIKINGCYYVDGGLLNNFPVKIFCDPQHTLGLNLHDEDSVLTEQDNEIAKVPIKTLIGFSKSIFMSVYANLQQTRVNDFDADRIIPIFIGNIPVLKFDLSDEEIQFLIDAGRNSVIRYFENK